VLPSCEGRVVKSVVVVEIQFSQREQRKLAVKLPGKLAMNLAMKLAVKLTMKLAVNLAVKLVVQTGEVLKGASASNTMKAAAKH
jgi:hypothetical protein